MFRVMEDAGGAAACARNLVEVCARNLVEVGARMWISVDPLHLPRHGVSRSKFSEDCAQENPADRDDEDGHPYGGHSQNVVYRLDRVVPRHQDPLLLQQAVDLLDAILQEAQLLRLFPPELQAHLQLLLHLRFECLGFRA